MFNASLARSGRQICALAARRATPVSSPQRPARKLLQDHVLALDPRTCRVCYSTTPALFRKYEAHLDHVNINKTPLSSNKDDSKEDEDQNLLSNNDDLMVGNEGLETIDPKDFPELYPGEDDIEGLSQESHPDNERDFEDLSKSPSKSASILLSDKERSEEEFSWFVDDSFPEKAAAGGHLQTDDVTSSQSSDFIPLWQKNAQRSPGDTEAHKDDHSEHSADSVTELVKLIESERAKNVKVIDMRDKCDWTEWMIIAEGLSERHLGNVADQVYSALKKSSPKTSPPVMEGRDTSNWVVIDAGSVVIHFMTHEARKERDLEGLWASVKNPLKLKDVEEISWDDVKGKMTKSWKESPGRSRGEDGKRGRRGETDIPLSEVVKW